MVNPLIAAASAALTACAVGAQADWSLVPAGGLAYGARSPWTSFDIARNRVVAFGGGSTTGHPTGETWEFDGVAWHDVTFRPAPREGGRMAYDPLRRVHVYLEPADAQAPGQPQRVWEWDGLSWADRTPPVMPPSRSGGDLAYDPVNRGVLLFGGSSVAPYFPPPLLDTWLWDGTSWRDMQPANHPVSRTAISDLNLVALLSFPWVTGRADRPGGRQERLRRTDSAGAGRRIGLRA